MSPFRDPPSGQEFANDLAVARLRDLLVSTLVKVRELPVVKPQQVQQRHVQVLDRVGDLDGVAAQGDKARHRTLLSEVRLSGQGRIVLDRLSQNGCRGCEEETPDALQGKAFRVPE